MSKNKKYKALFNAMDNNAELETIPFDTIAKAVKNCSTVTTTSLLEDLEDLVGNYQRDKVSKKQVIETLESIVKYEKGEK
jgi:hypothetical protein